MHYKKVRSIFGFVAVIFLLISLVLSISPSSAQGFEGKPPLKIVQLGDSYSAGNGARSASNEVNYKGPANCFRSPTNWGSQFANSLKDTFAVTYINQACSGGVVINITKERHMGAPYEYISAGHCPTSEYLGEEYRPLPADPTLCERFLKPQIDAIDTSVDLVVMTIGGNDLGFDDIVKQCFMVGYRGALDCKKVVDNARNKLPTLQTDLVKTFAAIKARLRPGAKIAYVAYPQLSLDEDYIVYWMKGTPWEVSYHAAKEVRDLGVTGEAYQKAAVDAANTAAGENYIVFYDGTKTLFAGHEPDPSFSETNPVGWINEFFASSEIAEWYHPNPEGHENWGRALSTFETFGADSGYYEKGADVDVAFVVDTTGSMGGEIAEVRANLSSLVTKLKDTTSSYRVAVVSYRDFPQRTGASYDYPSKVIQPFTSDPALIQAGIDALTLGYGGDTPETVFSGIQSAIDLPWRPGVTKIAIVLGDAPALSPEPISNLTATQIVANSIAVDPVKVVGVNVGSLNSNGALGQIAAGTGGSVISGTSGLTAAILDILDRAAHQPFAWIGQDYSGKIGQPVEFDASGSYDPSGFAITRYEWDFNGDGTFDFETTDATATHVYDAAFNGFVIMRVTSPGGTALASARTVVNEQGFAPQGNEESCALDENGFSIITDENGIFLNCKADHLPTIDKEGVTTEVIGSVESALANLENAINGLSPVAFRNKYLVIKDAVESNNTASACGSLQGMTGLANAQAGKKITQDQAAAVLKAVSKLETILGCPK